MTRYAPVALLADRPWGRSARLIADGHRTQVEALVNAAGYVEVFGPAEHMADDELGEHHAITLVMKNNERLKNSDAMADVMRRWMAEGNVAKECTRFTQAGRHIVQFDAALTTEFRHTDLDGVLLEDLELPWSAFYIAFDGPDAPGNDEMPIEGCFISFTIDTEGKPDHLTIMPAYKDGHLRGDLPAVRLAVKINGRDIESAFREDVEEIAGVTASTEKTLAPLVTTDRHRVIAKHLAEAIPKTFDAQAAHRSLSLTLNLVGNALLYLTTRPDDGATEWQRDAPADLLEKANSMTARARKAGQALVKNGYTRVRYIGLPASETQALGGTVRAHWRRGHWRRQRHGPGNASIKIVRIRPTLVAGSATEANASGRVHNVTRR